MKNKVTVFFASDEHYLPYLTVAISSLANHSSAEYEYKIIILTTSLDDMELGQLKASLPNNISLSVCNLTEKIADVQNSLSVRLRDYYSESIYYRMFIPSTFGELERAVYLDSDIVLCDDIAKLYNMDIASSLVAAVPDETVGAEPVFIEYVKDYIGIPKERYFNSGVLLMNLTAMREARIEERFLDFLTKYNYDTVAPDQDYLNYLCRGRVHYLEAGWNKHPIFCQQFNGELHIMHYNMFFKPWHYFEVPGEELFWEAARDTHYLERLIAERHSYTDIQRQNDLLGAKALLEKAQSIMERGKATDMRFGCEKIPMEVI